MKPEDSERRSVNYVAESAVAHLQQFEVYKFFERSTFPPDCFQSTFAKESKLEFRIGLITMDPRRRGISCHEVLITVKRLMRKMEKNRDKLVLFRCDGYSEGIPEKEHTGTVWTSALVRALRPVELICTYEELVWGA